MYREKCNMKYLSTMNREQIEKQYGNPNDLPEIIVKYCYNRVVVSWKDGYLEHPIQHTDVMFGWFFNFRLNRAIDKIISKHF